MKLLAPQQTADAANAEIARGILRLQALEEAEKELRIKLAKTEADFNATLAKNREIWAKEEEAHMLRLKEMDEEIKNHDGGNKTG